MIRRFFRWRARRQHARTRYRLDRRLYRGQFTSGFLSHLQSAQFWESDRDPFMRRTRWRRRLLILFLVALVGFFIWLGWESLQAFTVL